jgi:hypothetical protein
VPLQAALRTTPPQSRSSSVATNARSALDGGADSVASNRGLPRTSPVSGASTPPQGQHLLGVVAEPDRAAALGAALVDIVRARNDRERFATATNAGGALTAELAYRGAGSVAGPGSDAKALDVALTEQGKYRPTAEVMAAREAEWQAMQGGSAAAAAMRRTLRGDGDANGAWRGRGGGVQPEGSPSAAVIVPLGPVHRTAPPQAVESAGVSLVRALSAARIGSAGAAAAFSSPSPDGAAPDDMDVGHAAAAAQPPAHVAAEAPLPCGGVPEAGAVVVVACTSGGDMHFIDARDGATQLVVDIRVGDAHEPQQLQAGLTFCVAALAALGLVVTSTDCVDATGAQASLLRAWPLAAGDGSGQQSAQQCFVLTLPPQAGRVLALTSLDDRRLVAACSTGCLVVWTTLPAWNPTSGSLPPCPHDVICTSPDITLPITSLAPLPGAEVAAAGEDGVVRLWGTWDGGLEAELRGHCTAVTALEALEGGAVLVSADAGGSLRVWDLMTGECTRQLLSGSEVNSLWAAPSGLLLAASSDGSLVLWRAQDGVSAATASVPGGGLAAVHQLGGFHHALALCLDGRLRVLAARDGAPLLQLGGVEGVTAVEVTGNRPAAPGGGHDARSRCGPVRVRDRLWCFAGGNRLC